MLSSAANATLVTIDFSGHTTGFAIGDTYQDLGVVFESGTFGQCFGGCPEPTPDGNFAYTGEDGSVIADFSSPQTDITFQLVSYSSVIATAYDGATPVATVTASELFPISGDVLHLTGENITRVIFASIDDNFHAGITNLTFDAGSSGPPIPVPEPSTWAMMLVGFAGLGFAARRATRARALPG